MLLRRSPPHSRSPLASGRIMRSPSRGRSAVTGVRPDAALKTLIDKDAGLSAYQMAQVCAAQ